MPKAVLKGPASYFVKGLSFRRGQPVQVDVETARYLADTGQFSVDFSDVKPQAPRAGDGRKGGVKITQKAKDDPPKQDGAKTETPTAQGDVKATTEKTEAANGAGDDTEGAVGV